MSRWIVLTSVLLAAGGAARAEGPRAPQAPPVPKGFREPAAEEAPGYAAGIRQALKEGRELVVFVGQPAHEVAGALVCCSPDGLEGFPAQCVVVCWPKGGAMVTRDAYLLEGTPTPSNVASLLAAVRGELRGVVTTPRVPPAASFSPVSYQPTFGGGFGGANCRT